MKLSKSARAHLAGIGRRGGASTSKAKKQASRSNGKRGGWWAQKRNREHNKKV